MLAHSQLGITEGSTSLGIFSPNVERRKQIERFFYYFREDDLRGTRELAHEAALERNWESIEANRQAYAVTETKLFLYREQFRRLYGEDLLPTQEPPMAAGPFLGPPGQR